MDLYEALEERQVSSDDPEAGVVEQYRLLGKSIRGLKVIDKPDGTLLFPSVTKKPLVRSGRDPQSVTR